VFCLGLVLTAPWYIAQNLFKFVLFVLKTIRTIQRSDKKERKQMTTHRTLNSNKILEITTGVILFAIATAMRLAPPGIRDDSGEAYIMIACLLVIGSWLLFTGLFKNHKTIIKQIQ
jgi:hypothetical protein